MRENCYKQSPGVCFRSLNLKQPCVTCFQDILCAFSFQLQSKGPGNFLFEQVDVYTLLKLVFSEAYKAECLNKTLKLYSQKIL